MARYPDSFPWLGGTSSVLILHLSLCDFLYCSTGLPVFLSIFINGYFTWVSSSCADTITKC